MSCVMSARYALYTSARREAIKGEDEHDKATKGWRTYI